MHTRRVGNGGRAGTAAGAENPGPTAVAAGRASGINGVWEISDEPRQRAPPASR